MTACREGVHTGQATPQNVRRGDDRPAASDEWTVPRTTDPCAVEEADGSADNKGKKAVDEQQSIDAATDGRTRIHDDGLDDEQSGGREDL